MKRVAKPLAKEKEAMKKVVTTSLFVLAAIALLGLSSAAAEELWVVKGSVMDKEALAPGATDNNYCRGCPEFE